MYVPIGTWADKKGISLAQAIKYARLKRISDCKGEGFNILVDVNAKILPVSSEDAPLPQFPLSKGQAKIRRIIKGYRNQYQSLSPDSSTRADFQNLVKKIRTDISSDTDVNEDGITGQAAVKSNYHRSYLDFLARECLHVEGLLSIQFKEFVDCLDRGDDPILGVKYDSTIHALLGLDSKENIPSSNLDITIFETDGVVYIHGGGAHRSLAALLFGADSIKASSARIVKSPIDQAANTALMGICKLTGDTNKHVSIRSEADLAALQTFWRYLNEDGVALLTAERYLRDRFSSKILTVEEIIRIQNDMAHNLHLA
ncbi:hypothetical protein [Deinococcus sp. Marseille-Q6407]|uniref:hypothetical protein n=1 Tax=Deinococcus sp. Marseille-Q6407 TaxID=2969223 RepID=UPI0021C0F6CD|nr:hypothetical protein [Deinococcus sp. Marseille-Q6407]